MSTLTIGRITDLTPQPATKADVADLRERFIEKQETRFRMHMSIGTGLNAHVRYPHDAEAIERAALKGLTAREDDAWRELEMMNKSGQAFDLIRRWIAAEDAGDADVLDDLIAEARAFVGGVK